MKLCVKCKSPASLSCGRCSDSYCSPMCQINDWSAHRFICFAMPQLVSMNVEKVMPSTPTDHSSSKFSMPPPAVLNTFATPPPEAEIQEIKLNSAKSIQLFKPTSVMAAEKLRWKHHVSIDKMLDEFFEVVVYNIIASETTPSVFVMETHNQRKFNQFLKNTTKMYEKPPVSKCTFEVLKIGQLVITQFEGEFMYRAEVIGKDEAYKEVRMRLVDCGTEFILKNFDQLRRPTIELMNQEAFGFEVFVDPKVDYLKLGDKIMIKLTRVAGKIKRGEIANRPQIVEIIEDTPGEIEMKQDTLSLVSSFKGHANMMRMQHQIEEKSTKKLFQEDHKVILTREEERLKCEANKKLFEEERLKREAQLAADREKTQLAEELERLKMQEERDVANQELLKRKDAQSSQMAKDRYNINDLKLQKLPLAQSIQVKLLDLSMLMDEKIVTVCENTPENLAMHNQIQAEINKYCAEEKRLTGYKPIALELILAKFDGQFFRAMCMDNVLEDGMYPVQYIDYGNINRISPADMMPIPKALLDFANITHVCFVEGFDGKMTEDRLRLIKQNSAAAVVNLGNESEGCLYSITIDGF